MAHVAQPISEAQWESHREEITKLYCDQRMTQKKVEKFMAEERSFVATKSQYEARFNLWNLRKKHSKATWTALDSKMGPGQDPSSLSYHGRPIDARKVKKAISRYRNLLLRQGPLSPGFELADPDTAMTPVLIPRAKIPLMRLTPSLFSFRKVFMRNLSESGPHQMSIMASLRNAIPSLGLHVASTMDQNRGPATVETVVVNPTRTPPSTKAISVEAIFPLNALESWKDNIGKLMNPPTPSGQVELCSDLDQPKLHLLVYAMSNNMIEKLGFENLRDVWTYLRQALNNSSTQILYQMMQGSYSKSVWWKVLQGAIEAGDAVGCADIIRLGRLQVDDVICLGTGEERLTAIELAALLDHTDILEILLKQGGDPSLTQSYAMDYFKATTWGALHLALTNPSSWPTQHWRECRRVDQTNKAAALLLSTEPWATTSTDIDFTIAVGRIGGVAGLEYMLRAATPYSPFELSRAILNRATAPEFRRNFSKPLKYGGVMLRLLELIMLSPQKSPAWFTQPPSRAPGCMGEQLLAGRIEAALRYTLERDCMIPLGLEKCSCGMQISDCLSAWFGDSSSPPEAPRETKQDSESSGMLSQPEIVEIFSALVDTCFVDPKNYWKSVWRTCKPGWDPREAEDALLKAALKIRSEDLVRRLLEARQTILVLEDFLLDISRAIENAPLVHLLLTTGFTSDCLDWAQPERHYAEFFASSSNSKTLKAFIERGLWLDGEISWDCVSSIIQKGDCVRLRQIAELHVRRDIHYLTALVCEKAPSEHLDALFETLWRHRPARRALAKTVQTGRELVAAAARGREGIARKLVMPEMSAHATYSESGYPTSTLLGSLIEYDTTHENQICKLVIRKFCRPAQVDRFADCRYPDIFSTSPTMVMTPLLLAVEHGKLDIVQLLVLDYKADVNLTPRLGVKRTPLQQAAESGRPVVAQWLLDHGAHVNGPINEAGGATALQLAAIGGYCGIMETLINAGADLNAPGASWGGRTALEGAAEHGRIDAVNLLLGSGVLITGDGKESLLRAIVYAKNNVHYSIAELLRDSRDEASLGTIEQGDVDVGTF
ncbi:ankyrin repeat domain-containing protein 50 [Microdochium nivale]|nr:ankyrin repeat domain-containing protein 50 [Microdochium nivale]